MVYRRKDRPSFYSEVKTRDGWQQICWKVDDRRLATKMELMWSELAERHRAWDVLHLVVTGELDVRKLYDHWTESKQDIHALRTIVDDFDVAPLVEQYLKIYRAGDRTEDTADKVENYLGALLGPEKPLPRSRATPDYLSQRLAEYVAKGSTRRKIHSAWSGFFDYLVGTKRLLATNPMQSVERPGQPIQPIEFYESETVERIINHQATADRRALFALIYGTGMDVSPAVALVRGEINPDTREARCRGTKASTRDRIARIADWAWPIFWAHARLIVPSARVFGGFSRNVSHWHVKTVRALTLDPELPLRKARHHWAVRMLRAGAPVQMVQEQLGHSSPDITLRTYGPFLTDPAQRTYWERKATEYEAGRRAGGGEQ